MATENDKNAVNEFITAFNNLEKKQAQLKRALASFKKGTITDPCAVNRWIKANKELLEKEDPSILSIEAETELLCRDALLRFESELKEAFEEAGLSLSGQWPKYYAQHIIQVVIDEEQSSVKVGEEKFKSLSAEAIVSNLKSQLNKLTLSPEKLQEFLTELFEAYTSLSSRQNLTVSIWDLYKQLVINRQTRKFWRDASQIRFHAFTEVQFRAYLTQLLKANTTTISSFQLRLLPPITQDESIYIYQPVENRFALVGRVQFLPATGENNYE